MRLSFPATAQLLIPFFCAFVLFGCKKDESSSTKPTAAKSVTIVNATLDSAIQSQMPGSYMFYKLTFTNTTGDTIATTLEDGLSTSNQYISPAATWNGLNYLVPLSATTQNNLGVVMSYKFSAIGPDSLYTQDTGPFIVNLDDPIIANQHPNKLVLYNITSGYPATKITLDLLWQ